MENFDIEKLEKKNIYKTKEDFFNKVQNNVFETIGKSEVAPSKSVKIFKLKPIVYAVAASLVLIFGILFIQNSNKNTTIENANLAVTENKEANIITPIQPLEEQKTISESNTEINEPKIIQPKSDLVIVENSVAEKSQNDKKSILKKQPKTSAELQMQEFLNSFSSAELADLSSGSEQDVYLDLYK